MGETDRRIYIIRYEARTLRWTPPQALASYYLLYVQSTWAQLTESASGLTHGAQRKSDLCNCCTRSYYREIAPLGQASAQVPHSVHCSGLIEYFSPSEIAPTGHSSIHVPHATQSSPITYAIILKFNKWNFFSYYVCKDSRFWWEVILMCLSFFLMHHQKWWLVQ